MWLSILFPGYLPQKFENIQVNIYVLCSFIYGGQDLESTSVLW